MWTKRFPECNVSVELTSSYKHSNKRLFILQVQVEALNDSKIIGICIYNIIILSVLGTAVSFTIEDDVNMMYGFTAAILNTGTMATASILFIPKVIKISSVVLCEVTDTTHGAQKLWHSFCKRPYSVNFITNDNWPACIPRKPDMSTLYP